ncbi:MAG: flagellar biosynthesis anti-sigma factor FlgM [Desulfobacca sp. 4484_104]|nr:MAG: flagellar biosynthesis anti-sigma factor FlgM [Desulfobacca sp. 4484_104]RLA88476.1 MAG: flagellar biosynthesis anti-sigma factor FlgM [Deltaproteobacteria bacterium]
MKIEQVQSNSIDLLRTDKTNQIESHPETSTSQRSNLSEMDRIELSRESKLLQKASEVITQTPEIRAEKVQTISQAIQENSYQVDSHKIANAIIANAIMER